MDGSFVIGKLPLDSSCFNINGFGPTKTFMYLCVPQRGPMKYPETCDIQALNLLSIPTDSESVSNRFVLSCCEQNCTCFATATIAHLAISLLALYLFGGFLLIIDDLILFILACWHDLVGISYIDSLMYLVTILVLSVRYFFILLHLFHLLDLSM